MKNKNPTLKCECVDPFKKATPKMACYVKSPEHFNCFYTYIHFNEYEHTWYQIRDLLGMSSHQLVDQTIKRALEKFAKKKFDLLS